MANRSYGQYCGLAHALDVIGERWSLLIIRELLTGPQRYMDLLQRLPGLSTNLLAKRLKHLRHHDIIALSMLPPPATARTYTLTDRGRTLTPILIDLAQWGLQTIPAPNTTDMYSTGAVLLALQANFQVDNAYNVDENYSFHIGEDMFYVRIHAQTLTTHLGPAPNACCAITTNASTLLSILAGSMTIHEAVNQGQLKVSGDRDAWYRCTALLNLSALRNRGTRAIPMLDLTGRGGTKPRRLR